jgi:hypothetical protein
VVNLAHLQLCKAGNVSRVLGFLRFLTFAAVAGPLRTSVLMLLDSGPVSPGLSGHLIEIVNTC